MGHSIAAVSRNVLPIVNATEGNEVCSTLTTSPAKRIAAMGSPPTDGALAATGRFRLEEHGVDVGKAIELEPRYLLPDKTLDRLQRRQFLAIHEGKGIAHILRAAGPANAVHVILGMLRYIVIDHVAYPCDVDPARRDIGRDHDFVFAGFETF